MNSTTSGGVGSAPKTWRDAEAAAFDQLEQSDLEWLGEEDREGQLRRGCRFYCGHDATNAA